MGFDSNSFVMVRTNIFSGKFIYKNLLRNHDNSDYYNNIFRRKRGVLKNEIIWQT